jgi:hypothetical protein
VLLTTETLFRHQQVDFEQIDDYAIIIPINCR